MSRHKAVKMSTFQATNTSRYQAIRLSRYELVKLLSYQTDKLCDFGKLFGTNSVSCDYLVANLIYCEVVFELSMIHFRVPSTAPYFQTMLLC